MEGHSAALKYASLATLCAQNAAIYLIMRYVRSRQTADAFIISTAVTVSEVLKVAACLVIVLVEKQSLWKMLVTVYDHTIRSPRDCLKICVPSMLYVVQNNLLYLALSHLDAVTYQVLYQFKILTTAVFSVVMLKRHLSYMQWGALTVLFLGVTVVQLDIAHSSQTHTHDNSTQISTQRPLIGIMAAASGSIISGFAGVFLEKILKGTQPSIFIRNIQMGLLGIVISSISVLATDMEAVKTRGFFAGYDHMVWLVVCLHSFGGLITAAVMKYADNILKGYAFAISILSSAVVSYFFLDLHIDTLFVMGSSAVIFSVILYGRGKVKDTDKKLTIVIAKSNDGKLPK